MTACTICLRDAPEGHRLCQLHADELRAWLAELPRQARLMEEFVAPAGRPHTGRLGGSGRAHAPAPVDLRVLTLLAHGHPAPVGEPDDDTDTTVPLLAFVSGWAGHIAYHYPALNWHPDRDPAATLYVTPCEQAWPTHGATITGWCAWLTAYLPHALTHPWIADLHRQLGDLIARIHDLTHGTPHRHHKAAPCPACTNLALVATDGQWGVRCEACGHQMDPEDYNQHAATVLRTEMPLDKIAT